MFDVKTSTKKYEIFFAKQMEVNDPKQFITQ